MHLKKEKGLLGSDHFILFHAKDDKVCPEGGHTAKGWRVQISNQNFQCLPTLWIGSANSFFL